MDWLESVIEYMRLGLELGLSYTFAQNDTPGTGQEGKGLQIRTLVQSWLERADRVEEMGGTNKPALVAALRRMGEHRVADSIISGLRCGCILPTLYTPYPIILDISQYMTSSV